MKRFFHFAHRGASIKSICPALPTFTDPILAHARRRKLPPDIGPPYSEAPSYCPPIRINCPTRRRREDPFRRFAPFRGTEMFFPTPIVGKSAEGVFPTSEGGAIDAYGWAIAWSVRKRRTELWRTLTPPGVSPNRVRKGGQSRANPLNGCALTQKVS